MVSLVARTTMKFGGKVFKPGDTFELDERYARTLLATRQAERAPNKPNKEPPKKAGKDEATGEPAAKDKKAKTYKTRRMKADDE